MKKYTCILLDDEHAALKGLEQKIIKNCSNLEVKGTFQKPKEAKAFLDNHEVNLVFLDIQMPQLDGFEFLQSFDTIPFQVIFVTAYSEYAIEALKNNAVDYLLKPIDTQDLLLGVEKAIELINKNDLNEYQERLKDLMNKVLNNEQKLVIPTTKGLSFIPQDEVLHLEGYDGYSKIHLTNGTTILSSYSLGKFSSLMNDSFFKCHKSHVINLKEVKGYENEGYLLLDHEYRVPISKTYRSIFLELFKQ